MKKKSFSKKLTLNKQTISDLTKSQLKSVYGGGGDTGIFCNSRWNSCVPINCISNDGKACP